MPPMLPEIERRYLNVTTSKLELRKKDEAGFGQLDGYAAMFNSISEDLGWFHEILEPGCFTECLRASDLETVALFNHNPDLVLARYPGTLRLKEDAIGLWSEMDLVDTQCGRDCRTNVEARNVYQMSFAFTVDEADWIMKDGQEIRRVVKVRKLYDVSPVTYPAYSATSINARGEGAAGINFRKVTDLISRVERKQEVSQDNLTYLRNTRDLLDAACAAEEYSPDSVVAFRAHRLKSLRLRR